MEQATIALISAALGGLITPLLLKGADHLFGKGTRNFDQAKAFRDELRAELNVLRERVAVLDERNDVLVRENARLEGRLAAQETQLAVLGSQLKTVLQERDGLKRKLEQLSGGFTDGHNE